MNCDWSHNALAFLWIYIIVNNCKPTVNQLGRSFWFNVGPNIPTLTYTQEIKEFFETFFFFFAEAWEGNYMEFQSLSKQTWTLEPPRRFRDDRVKQTLKLPRFHPSGDFPTKASYFFWKSSKGAESENVSPLSSANFILSVAKDQRRSASRSTSTTARFRLKS